MRGECIYLQVAIQTYQLKMDWTDLASKLGMSYSSLRRKLRGSSKLTLDEAKEIQKVLNCGLTLDELFMDWEEEIERAKARLQRDGDGLAGCENS